MKFEKEVLSAIRSWSFRVYFRPICFLRLTSVNSYNLAPEKGEACWAAGQPSTPSWGQLLITLPPLLQISPSPKPHTSLPPLPLYDQPPSSPYPSPDKRSSQFFPRSPSASGKCSGHTPSAFTSITLASLLFSCQPLGFSPPENSLHAESPGFSQASRQTPDTSYGKLRPVSLLL